MSARYRKSWNGQRAMIPVSRISTMSGLFRRWTAVKIYGRKLTGAMESDKETSTKEKLLPFPRLTEAPTGISTPTYVAPGRWNCKNSILRTGRSGTWGQETATRQETPKGLGRKTSDETRWGMKKTAESGPNNGCITSTRSPYPKGKLGQVRRREERRS